jgi:hypothetical protein
VVTGLPSLGPGPESQCEWHRHNPRSFKRVHCGTCAVGVRCEEESRNARNAVLTFGATTYTGRGVGWASPEKSSAVVKDLFMAAGGEANAERSQCRGKPAITVRGSQAALHLLHTHLLSQNVKSLQQVLEHRGARLTCADMCTCACRWFSESRW